jgi:hypothetical protein
MSGQAVIHIVVTTGASGLALAGAFGAALMIKNVVDCRINKANEDVKEHLKNIKQWQAFQLQQQKEMALTRELYQTVASALDKLCELQLVNVLPSEAGKEPVTGPPLAAKGYVNIKAKQEQLDNIRKLMEGISNILADMPQAFVHGQHSPYKEIKRLEKIMRQKLDTNQIKSLDEVETFHQAIIRSVMNYLGTIDSVKQQQDELLGRAERLLGNVITFATLTYQPNITAELDGLRENLLKLLISSKLQIGSLEILEKKYADLKAQVDAEMDLIAFRKVLGDSVQKHLKDMGYTMQQEFEEDKGQGMIKGEMQIPGGERLQIAIQRNKKIAFQVLHETGAAEEDLTGDELAFFRQQEKKWCSHMQDLFHNLAKEGFLYEIKLEQQVDEKTIPLVVMETSEEILKEEKRRKQLAAEPKKKHLSE